MKHVFLTLIATLFCLAASQAQSMQLTNLSSCDVFVQPYYCPVGASCTGPLFPDAVVSVPAGTGRYPIYITAPAGMEYAYAEIVDCNGTRLGTAAPLSRMFPCTPGLPVTTAGPVSSACPTCAGATFTAVSNDNCTLCPRTAGWLLEVN